VFLPLTTHATSGVTSIAWDRNEDGIVDSDDTDYLDGLGLGLGETISDPTYRADFDLNRDGVVDGDDVLLTESWFGHGGLPAGAISEPAGPGSPIGYTGHVFDPESALYLARHRTYSPALGRWLTEDPAGEVDGPNLYQYALSSPVVFGDYPIGSVRTQYNQSDLQQLDQELEEFVHRVRPVVVATCKRIIEALEDPAGL
jgi:RHS repeat-associated protein